MSIRRSCRAWVVGLIAVSVAGLNASATVAQDELPDVQEILRAHIEALGGESRLREVRSIVTRGTIEAPASGHRGEVTLWQVPGKYLLEIQMFEVGTIQQGSDGEVVWEIAPQGERLLDGRERVTAILNNAQLFPELQWIDDDFDGSIRLIDRVKHDGRDVYQVEFKPEDGYVITRHFDAETFLVVHGKALHQDAEGAGSEVDINSSEFKEVDGITMPFRQEYRREGNPFYTIVVREIQFNEEIEDSKFDFPPQVKQLVERRDDETSPTEPENS